VVASRLVDIYTLMELHEHEDAHALSLCRVAAEITELSGAGISLASSYEEMTALCCSDATAQSLMDLEMTLHEGPTVDVGRSGRMVGEAHLAHPLGMRWPLYAPEALAIGAHAVFGFPVQVGAVRFGALSLFRLSPGPLSASQEADGYLMASVIARSVLSMQAGTPEGELLGELHGGPRLDFRVHQAAGMVAVQGSFSVKDALVALRAQAFSSGRELSELAERVVTRSTYLEPSSGEWRDVSVDES
jgi:hypothetical protein